MMQAILDLFEAPRYLEIGVQQGKCFLPMRAQRKVGVDPTFQFDWQAYQAATEGCSLHAMRSDDYFGGVATQVDQFDVIFLDGFHTLDQTLRDFNNAILHLAPKGILVIDDVVPTSYAASLPDPAVTARMRQTTGDRDKSWMGDVYKLVFFIAGFFQQFDYRTVTDHHGQLVAWRQARPSAELARRSLAEIAALPYAEVLTSNSVYKQASLAETLRLLSNRPSAT